MRVFLYILFAIFLFSACEKKSKTVETPWGTTLDAQSDTASAVNQFNLDDIISNGELIMITMSGPDTYYTYHGRGMGAQYMLCERFARQIGVSLRVEVCRDTVEMISKLKNGEGDVIAFPLPARIVNADRSLMPLRIEHSVTWAVNKGNTSLADTLRKWYHPGMLAKIVKEENFLFTSKSIKRHVYSPMLDKGKGIISRYDSYFKMYSGVAIMDWRLMAAQCYQESCFDPDAQSWAGACGLMQIMPSTAAHLGLPMEMIHKPEENIAAAAKYLRELREKFRDISDDSQRSWFVLASYNGGYHHIKDAQRLTSKYGHNPGSWADVSQYVLKLRNPAYYNDPVVKYGYMRGEETFDYVQRIRDRWMQYRGMASSYGSFSSGFGAESVPQKAKHKNKFQI